MMQGITSTKRIYPSYPKYKDAGIEWLARIPEGWKVKRLKDVALINPETLPENTDSNFLMKYIDITGVTLDSLVADPVELYFKDAPSRARRVVKEDDVILSTVRTYLKAIAYFQEPEPNFIASTGFAVLRATQKVIPKFLYYLVRNQRFIDSVMAYSVGVSYPAINSSTLGCLKVWLPTIEEQQAIVYLLDRETGKIDQLIEKKQKFIELMKEKRIALISNAVTKGLNPNIRMKESGIGWVGKIPEGWEAKKIKYVFVVINGATPRSENPDYWNGEICWITPDDLGKLQSDSIISSERQITNEGYTSCGTTIVPAGSLVLSTRAPIGHLGIANVSLCTNQGCRSLKFKNVQNSKKYFYYLLSVLKNKFDSLGQGSTFKELSKTKLESVLIPYPNPVEQGQIANFLDRETSKIDSLIQKIEIQIEKLKEYRTALISETVTGRIMVE